MAPKRKKFVKRKFAKSAVPTRTEVSSMIDRKIRRAQEKMSFSRSLNLTIQNNNVVDSTSFQQLIYTENKAEVSSKTPLYGPREDNMITLQSLRFRGVLTANAAGQPQQTIRVLIVATGQSATPTVRQVLDVKEGDGSTAYNAHERSFYRALTDEEANSSQQIKYQVLVDELITVYPSSVGIGAPEKYFNFKAKLPKAGHKIYYSGPDNNDRSKGMIYGIAFQNGSSVQKPTLNIIQKIKYNT